MKQNPLDPTVSLPHDEASEIAILAACMDVMESNRRLAFSICNSCITPQSFFLPTHGAIWRVLQQEDGKGTPMTLDALILPLLAQGVPIADVADIASRGNPSPEAFQHALGRVVNCQILRGAFSACYASLQAMADPLANAQQAIAEAQTALTGCLLSTKMETGKTLKELWLSLMDQMQTPEKQSQPIATGIKCLDGATRGGPRRGQMVLLGALRHVGKTAFARQIALNVGRAGHKVLCFFAESSDADESINTMAAATGRATADFQGGKVSAGTTSAMMGQLRQPIPEIRIDTTASLSVDIIENRCRYLHQTKGLDVVFVDYLQFLNSRQSYKGQNREQMVADDARRLKVLARELDVVLYLLVQLNDEITPEETPEIRHIRESKGPSNHADVILLMSAPDGIDHDQTQVGKTISRRHLWNRKWRGVGAHSKPFEMRFVGASQQFLPE